MGRRRFGMASAIVAASSLLASCSEFSSGNETQAGPDASSPSPPGDASTSVDAGPDGDATPPCPNASCGEVIASGQANAAEVLVDEKRVYWTIESDTGTVMARGHEAGTVPYPVLSDGVKPRSLIRFGEYLHFGSGGQVRHIDRSSINVGTSATGSSNASPITSVARRGNFVFATVGNFVQWCTTTSNSCTNGTFTLTTFQVGAGARALTVDSVDARVWLATDAELFRSEVASPSWLDWWPITKVQAIVADGTSVFVARRGEFGILRFQRDDLKTAQPTTLVPTAPPPWAMVIDGAFIFYTAIDQGVVMKVAKDGSSMKVLAGGLQSPNGIAVRLDKVYVALGDGRIVALPHQ